MNNKNPNELTCIMPERPYCPCCCWGFVTFDEEAAFLFPDEGLDTEWHCTYPGFLKKFK